MGKLLFLVCLVALLSSIGAAGIARFNPELDVQTKKNAITTSAISAAYECQADGWSEDECIAVTVIR